MPKLIDYVRDIAPNLASAMLGGGLLGSAAKNVLSAVLGAKPGTSDEQLEQLLGAAKPELLAQVKQAELDFQKRMAELDIDLEALYQKDRDSARQREISMRDNAPAVLAGVITVGFFGVLFYILKYGIPTEGGEALLVMLGALGTAWGGVVQYYFGSSAGSKQKTDALTLAVRK
jgi:hypothetical protein